MTTLEMARLHAAAMRIPRPWTATEIGLVRMMPGALEAVCPDGFALARATVDEAELLTIAVHPTARRRGTGRMLLERIHDAARSAGATRIFLEVAADNSAARALYETAGYVEVGCRRGYYAEGDTPIDAIILRRIVA